jgi:hypothetical protein
MASETLMKRSNDVGWLTLHRRRGKHKGRDGQRHYGMKRSEDGGW